LFLKHFEYRFGLPFGVKAIGYQKNELLSHCGQGFVVAEAFQALSVSFKWTSAGVLEK